MENKPGHSPGAPRPPDEPLPCVWMTAGLIAYKLCDREYDCEHCPLDAALRGVGSDAAGEHGSSSREPAAWEFRSDRLYHRFHTWVMPMEGARARVGLDVFAARLLGNVTSVVLPTEKSGLRQGCVACWLMDAAELIPLCAPVSGTVVRGNRGVQQHPGLVAFSPYDEGWLLEVQCRGRLEDQAGLITAADLGQQTAAQLQQLRRQVCKGLAKDDTVGPTMADGGVQLAEMRRILGPSRYHRLILTFLR